MADIGKPVRETEIPAEDPAWAVPTEAPATPTPDRVPVPA
jgi:hypothetical protein